MNFWHADNCDVWLCISVCQYAAVLLSFVLLSSFLSVKVVVIYIYVILACVDVSVHT